MSRFYQLVDDKQIPKRWYLEGPTAPDGTAVDARRFTVAERVTVGEPITVSIRRFGRKLDFTLADFGMPVVTAQLAEQINAVAGQDVQLLGAVIEGSAEPFAILNALGVVDCIDRNRSEIKYWTEADGLPSHVGRYFRILNLRVQAEKAAGHHVLRLKGWKPALIVSEEFDRFSEALLERYSRTSPRKQRPTQGRPLQNRGPTQGRPLQHRGRRKVDPAVRRRPRSSSLTTRCP